MKLTSFSDAELIKAYTKGNEAAIQELILRHKNRIYTYIICKVKINALAEDIFQDTFIKVINTFKKGKYNDEGKFLPWVMRIAHNLIIDHYRKKNKMPTYNGTEEFDIFDVISSPNKDVQEEMEEAQNLSEVKRLIKYLPNDQKEVLMMRLYYDMSFKEISVTTNVSINTALGRMRYALINLRKLIDERNLTLSIQ